jgi:hypothetical protein
MLLVTERIKSATHASNAAAFLDNVYARYGLVTPTLGSSIKFVNVFGVMCGLFRKWCFRPPFLEKSNVKSPSMPTITGVLREI